MKSKSYWKTARHATASFIALVFLLLTFYAQNQSSRYTASFAGFKRALHFDSAKQASTFQEIWKWFDMFTNSIAADTLDQINANCGYNQPNLQNVNIDGIEYKLYDPQYQFDPCSNVKYLNDPNEKVYLSDTGNHELKTVGVFTGRSTTTLSRSKDKVVLNNELATLDAATDDRIIEVCDLAPWGKPCILKDGFADSKISTLNWDGTIIDGYYAFDPLTSNSRVVTPGKDYGDVAQLNNFRACFHNVSGVLTSPDPGYTVDVNNPLDGYTGCHQTWVTPGYEVRKSCLNAQVTQADAKYAFMIAVANFSSLTEMRNVRYGCELILGLNEQQLKNSYLIDHEPVENSIENDKLHGFFIKTDTQGSWIEDSTSVYDQMAFSKLIDRHTRVFNVVAITKNDGDEDLYYAKIEFSFKMLVDGKIILRMESSYIPIVKYIYALDDYPWKFREIVICESFFVLILFLFTIREIHQDYTGIVRFMAILKARGSAKINDMRAEEESSVRDNEGKSGSLNNIETNNVESSHNDEEEVENGGECQMQTVEDGGDNREDVARVVSYSSAGDTAIMPMYSNISVAEMTLIPDDSNWYNIVDWLTILVGWLAVYYRVWYIQLCYHACNYLEDLDEESEPENDLSRHEESFGDTIDQFAEVENCETNLYIITGALVFICVIQFFRYLEFDARFGIVARTLRQSMWVLLPVLVVFITILSTYAVLGTCLYGKSLPEWSTFYNSLGSLFLLILGEFEGYPRMRNVSSSLTGIFFWTFVSFVILVLFNMVLAIILTVYDETYKVISTEIRDDDDNDIENKKDS
jgi:hypothetical protein